MNHSTMNIMDMQKVKTIMDDNKRLRELNNELEKKIKKYTSKNILANENADLTRQNADLTRQNEILRDRLKRFETMENQNIKEELEKNIKVDLLLAKKQFSIDAIKTFGLPDKKPNEVFGIVTTHVKSNHQRVLCIDCIPAHLHVFENLLNKGLNSGKMYNYVTNRLAPYYATDYQVLWIPSTGEVTYVFTKEQVESPINLREIYSY